MRKIYTLILSAILITAFSISAFACTPNLNLDIWRDLTPPSQITYEPSDEIKEVNKNAAESWLEEYPIDWSKEILNWESLHNHWKYFIRR